MLEPADDFDSWDEKEIWEEGCLFPGKCCMPGIHAKMECHTAEMIEQIEKSLGVRS